MIQYLYRDEPTVGRWQSGLETVDGVAKPAMGAVTAPLAQMARTGPRTALRGMVRPGSGARAYRLQRWKGRGWSTVGGAKLTRADGSIRREVRALPGARFRLLANGVVGNSITVR